MCITGSAKLYCSISFVYNQENSGSAMADQPDRVLHLCHYLQLWMPDLIKGLNIIIQAFFTLKNVMHDIIYSHNFNSDHFESHCFVYIMCILGIAAVCILYLWGTRVNSSYGALKSCPGPCHLVARNRQCLEISIFLALALIQHYWLIGYPHKKLIGMLIFVWLLDKRLWYHCHV